jgi:tetratricopeptide (TPR) repeat protein
MRCPQCHQENPARAKFCQECGASGTRALEIAARLGDLRLRISATISLAQADYYLGEYERSTELATDTLLVLPADWAHDNLGMNMLPSIDARYRLVMGLGQLGKFGEAVEHEAGAIRLAEPTHQAINVGRAHFAAGTLHLLKGDWLKARSLLERGITAYRTGNVALSLPHAVAASAWVFAQVGEASDALTRLHEGERLLERLTAGAAVDQHGADYHALGRTGLLLGRLDEARRLGDCAVKFSSSHPGYAAHAPAPARRHRDPSRLVRRRERRGPLPPGAEARRAARHAAARRPLPISVSASSTGARASGSSRRSTSPPRRRCTARWTCASIWNRRRRN